MDEQQNRKKEALWFDISQRQFFAFSGIVFVTSATLAGGLTFFSYQKKQLEKRGAYNKLGRNNGLLAVRALAYGTVLAVGGGALLGYATMKILGVSSVQEFSQVVSKKINSIGVIRGNNKRKEELRQKLDTTEEKKKIEELIESYPVLAPVFTDNNDNTKKKKK